MAYLGGKAKCAEHILNVLNDPQHNNKDYIEPFVGYCHILRRVLNKKSYTASDNNKYLIALLKHNQQTPNSHYDITKDEYNLIKANPDDYDILKSAYAAFCYSYNGKFFGGYVNQSKRRDNYPAERKRYYDKLHTNPIIKKTNFSYDDYTIYNNVKDALIYCDPPYRETTKYHNEFNSDAFWDWVRKMSKDNVVYVSEYTAPDDFECIAEKEKYNSVGGKGSKVKRVEKLWKLRQHNTI
jgi:DNA adenine methylase